MASSEEIRKWRVGIDRPNGLNGGALFFELPVQPASIPGAAYLRCVGEQRVIVLTEIAAQLADLNATLLEILEEIRVSA